MPHHARGAADSSRRGLNSSSRTALTYTNPVYHRSFPDPFVLKHGGEYFGFCTGFADDGRVFGVIRSDDLVNWEELPGAMDPLAPRIAAGDLYWAPEVTEHSGTFYLYYGVGNETLMQIRVATSAEPAGPYRDSGRKLTFQDFAIDPHVFIDDDGSWHMFYATDFLNYSHIGTGTVVDRMLDPFTLAGNPRPVTRAKYDWQVYDPARKEKGGVRWHTVEGPFVLKRKGKYFEMFSGGNWQNKTYGVGYAVSESVESDEEWMQQVDGIDTLPLLRTIPEKVIGPGHNSVVVGPDGREMFCVYHRWQDGERVMCIDRMDFAGGDRLFVAGPSYEPQRAPRKVSEGFLENFDAGDLARNWSIAGRAEVQDQCLRARASASDFFQMTREVPVQNAYELAVNLRVDEVIGDTPVIKIGSLALELHDRRAGWRLVSGETAFNLPGYDIGQFHQLRIVCDGGRSHHFLDDLELGSGPLAGNNGRVDLDVRQAAVTFDMVRYTVL
jgi:GH43 family beta-xylosidase